MGVLLVEIIKNISVIAVAVYIITQCKPFRRANHFAVLLISPIIRIKINAFWFLFLVYCLLSAII